MFTPATNDWSTFISYCPPLSTVTFQPWIPCAFLMLRLFLLFALPFAWNTLSSFTTEWVNNKIYLSGALQMLLLFLGRFFWALSLNPPGLCNYLPFDTCHLPPRLPSIWSTNCSGVASVWLSLCFECVSMWNTVGAQYVFSGAKSDFQGLYIHWGGFQEVIIIHIDLYAWIHLFFLERENIALKSSGFFHRNQAKKISSIRLVRTRKMFGN